MVGLGTVSGRRLPALPAVVALAVAALASGCTASSGATTATASRLGGHVLWWDIAEQTGARAAMTSLVSAFEQAHPGVTVDYVAVPANQARGRFDTAAQTTSGAPDVVTIDSSWVGDFASRGYLARLDETTAVTPGDDQLSNLMPTGKYDGRVVALPRSADGPALLYNLALLRQAGVSVPRTWAELASDQLRLTAVGVQTLYAPADSDGLLPWIYGEGGALVDPFARTIEVSSPASVAGFSLRLRLDATGVTVNDSSAGSVDAMRAAFRQGKVAMILDDAAGLPGLVGGAATPTVDSIGIAPVPAGSVTSSSPLTGTAYAVYAGSHNLRPSYDLVRFLDSDQTQVELAARLGLLPTRAQAYADPVLRTDRVVQAYEVVIRTGTPLPTVVDGEGLLGPLDDALRQGLTGGGSAQSILDGVAAAYNRKLPDFTIGPAPAPG